MKDKLLAIAITGYGLGALLLGYFSGYSIAKRDFSKVVEMPIGYPERVVIPIDVKLNGTNPITVQTNIMLPGVVYLKILPIK